MTYSNKNNPVSEILELVVEQGFGGMAEVIRLLINLAMEIKRDRYLGVLSYERSERRQGWRNG